MEEAMYHITLNPHVGRNYFLIVKWVFMRTWKHELHREMCDFLYNCNCYSPHHAREWHLQPRWSTDIPSWTPWANTGMCCHPYVIRVRLQFATGSTWSWPTATSCDQLWQLLQQYVWSVTAAKMCRSCQIKRYDGEMSVFLWQPGREDKG